MAFNVVRVKDFEEHAKTYLNKVTNQFYTEGTGHEDTLRNNIDAYKRYRIKPRYLRNVERRNMRRKILGKYIDMPIGISPTALHKLAHEEGECATAKAAQEFNTIFTLSSHSTTSLEEVAKAAPDARKWIQCYVFKSREITRDIIAAAERAGFEAIVITVDYPVVGERYSVEKYNFKVPKVPIIDKYLQNGMLPAITDLSNPTAEWSYIEWLKTITKLPIIAKGILTAEDAISAVNAGVSAILVSNHGARQLDGVPATIEALPSIVDAVGDKVEIYVDGGIRDGSDVFKALALGARMVFVGRPVIWGLSHSGEEGVKKVLSILKTELDRAIAMTGCADLGEVTRDRVVHELLYHKY